MIVIDERKVFEIIEERKPTSVALNGPDGILPKYKTLRLKLGKNSEFQHIFLQIQRGVHVILILLAEKS